MRWRGITRSTPSSRTCTRPPNEHEQPEADQSTGVLCRQSRSLSAAGASAAEARLAAARLSARLLGGRALALERLGAGLCRRGRQGRRVARAVLAGSTQSTTCDLHERDLWLELR